MYAVAIVRYRLPLVEVGEDLRQAHREYLLQLKKDGVLIASGPFRPHVGGILLFRVADENVTGALDEIRDGDPFSMHKIAQYELLPWDVKTGLDDLDRIP